jgi:hypothetical protein
MLSDERKPKKAPHRKAPATAAQPSPVVLTHEHEQELDEIGRFFQNLADLAALLRKKHSRLPEIPGISREMTGLLATLGELARLLREQHSKLRDGFAVASKEAKQPNPMFGTDAFLEELADGFPGKIVDEEGERFIPDGQEEQFIRHNINRIRKPLKTLAGLTDLVVTGNHGCDSILMDGASIQRVHLQRLGSLLPAVSFLAAEVEILRGIIFGEYIFGAH